MRHKFLPSHPRNNKKTQFAPGGQSEKRERTFNRQSADLNG